MRLAVKEKKTPALECIWHPSAKGKLQGKRLEDGEKPLQTNAVAVKQNVFFYEKQKKNSLIL